MTNGILCTIDFSPASIEALKWAAGLAKKMGSKLTVLYVYRLLARNDNWIELRKKTEADAKEKFCALEGQFLSSAGIHYEFKTEIGFIDDRIKAHMKEDKPSFVVMAKTMSENRENFDEVVAALQSPLVLVPA